MRFPEETVKRIDAAIDSANARRVEIPYDWTAWVRQAVKEKLRSLERGRASSKRRRKKPAAVPAGEAYETTTGGSAEPPVVGM
jgi:hypothetical protein